MCTVWINTDEHSADQQFASQIAMRRIARSNCVRPTKVDFFLSGEWAFFQFSELKRARWEETIIQTPLLFWLSSGDLLPSELYPSADYLAVVRSELNAELRSASFTAGSAAKSRSSAANKRKCISLEER